MPHTVLGTGDIEVNKTDTNPCLHGAVHADHLGVGKVQSPDSVGEGWGLRLCTCNRSPGDVNTAVLGTILGVAGASIPSRI